MEPIKDIHQLYKKHLADEISEQEKTILFGFFREADEQEIIDVIGPFIQNGSVPEDLEHLGQHATALFEKIRLRTIDSPEKVSPRNPKRQLYYWIPIAAAVAFISTFIIFMRFNSDNDKMTKDTVIAYDITPGKNGATLTLANGKTIRLNEAANGKILSQAGISIVKTADGQITYETKGTAVNLNNHTLTTAVGETYMLTLPDKSRVWMNSASSLTYPAALLEGKVRRVKLEGEAYFEVAKDKDHPFIVETENQRITVLGTHFNINSYKTEKETRTTLVEGSIKVASLADTTKSKILKPNQEAVLGSQGIAVHEVDPEFAMAWKEGFFMFDDENLESVMNRIARWYDVKIIYKDPSIRNNTLVGTMSRYDNISKVLQVLQSTKVATFELEGRTIVVKKK